MTEEEKTRFDIIRGPKTHPFRAKAARAYDDDPEEWRLVLGDLMHFQWGLYDRSTSAGPMSLDQAGSRHLDRQLELARPANQPPPQRVLDVGCGWGAGLHHLARAFPDCPRLDGVNISRQQLEYCANHLTRRGVGDRTRLYLCDAGDVGLLPDPEVRTTWY